MEPISFGLGLAGEVRHQVNSCKIRIANFQEGQSRYNSLTSKLDLFVKHMSEVERLLIAVPNTLPTATSADFHQILADVCDGIKNENWTMPQSLSKPFAGGSSSAIGKGKLKMHQFSRAKALNSEMSSLEAKIERASNKLLHLSSMLTNALNSKELQTIVETKIDQQRAEVEETHDAILSKLDNLSLGESVKGVYNPVVSTPAPSHTMILDFSSVDENGNPASPEGVLKQSVLYGESSGIVTAVTGSIKPSFGVLGMAGVGKTVALQGLGHDAEVKKRFDGGVHYMTFGRDATLQTALRELAKIMTLTGATADVENVKKSSSLREAVDYAVVWFGGKNCLYLLDDLWPAENLPHGYLDDLRQLLRGSPQSRMAISTRSVDIASEAGRVVDFGPRLPLGQVSVAMFMSHATGHSTPQSSSTEVRELTPSVSKILGICCGLPIALSVTGCAVSKLVRIYGTFEKACDAYAVKLEKKRTLLGARCTGYGRSLNAAIVLSLEHLEVELLECAEENSIQIDTSMFDLYVSLCVLSNQAWVPVSVLGRLWELDEDVAFDVASLFAGMSLATLTTRRVSSELSDEAGIALHDLQLDFCEQKAMETKKFSFWHTQLLNGYLESSFQPPPDEQNSEILGRIIHFTLRPWWSGTVPEDGYIHANLSRHLWLAGYGIELAALVLEGRWTQLRRRVGGILALEMDFEQLQNVFERDSSTGDIRRSFGHIFKAVRLSWGRMAKGLRLFQFHVCGRLAKIRNSSRVVDAYLKSIEKCTPKPYLLPVSSFFPDVDSPLIMEIPVGGAWTCVACSPCGRYIAYGAGSDIVIAKTSSGEKIHRIHGHGSRITCLAFSRGSKEIVSGSEDGMVMSWEWQMAEYNVRVFHGHDSYVTGVAINSDEGRIYSSSWDRTVRIWDADTAEQTWELSLSSGVICVAVSGDGAMIAFGLDEGTLRPGNRGWQAGTLKVIDAVTKNILFENKHMVSCVSFSPNGSHLATGSRDNTIRVWNTRSWTGEDESLFGHGGWVHCVSFSPDGKQIASSSRDGTIRLWDVESRMCVGISPILASPIECVSFTADRQRMISGSQDGIVRIWDALLATGSMENTFRKTASVRGAASRQNELRVASVSVERVVRLWHAQNEEQARMPFEGHTDAVLCVSISPDGRQLVSGSDDNTLRLWDMETGNEIGDPFEGHTTSVVSVSFSFDGLRIISSSRDCTVRIWNSETHEQIGDSLEGHRFGAYGVSESADGCHIVSLGLFQIIWNRDTRSIVWKSRRERGSAFDCTITDDEADSIIRSCDQQTLYHWPKSFPTDTDELYRVGDSVYSNLLGETTLVADTLNQNMSPGWSYHRETKLLAAGLTSGAIAVCKLIIE